VSVQIALTLGVPLSKRSFDWNYTTVPQAGYYNRTIPYARGFVLGGSSSISDSSSTMTYFTCSRGCRLSGIQPRLDGRLQPYGPGDRGPGLVVCVGYPLRLRLLINSFQVAGDGSVHSIERTPHSPTGQHQLSEWLMTLMCTVSQNADGPILAQRALVSWLSRRQVCPFVVVLHFAAWY
jgi:hypothetical protein